MENPRWPEILRVTAVIPSFRQKDKLIIMIGFYGVAVTELMKQTQNSLLASGAKLEKHSIEKC